MCEVQPLMWGLLHLLKGGHNSRCEGTQNIEGRGRMDSFLLHMPMSFSRCQGCSFSDLLTQVELTHLSLLAPRPLNLDLCYDSIVLWLPAGKGLMQDFSASSLVKQSSS